jgi:hypothetical protein
MKSKFLTSAFFIITLSFALVSCDPPPGSTVRYFFKIQNNSNTQIQFFVNRSYPDTTIPDSIPTISRVIILDPNAYKKFESGEKWPKFFSKLPADTLSIFYVLPATVSKYGWKQIQSKYLVLARKDISLGDLEKNNYLVTYP